MIKLFLILIFIRPFISSLAFPGLNLFYSGLLAAFLCVYLICKRPSFSNLKFEVYPVLLFIFGLYITLIFSKDRPNSLVELYKYMVGLLLFLVSAALAEKEQVLVVKAIALSGLAVGILALYQYLFGFSNLANYLADNNNQTPFIVDYLKSRRVFAPFVTPGILGGFLAMVIPLLLIFKRRYWFILPVFLALFLTKSLAAFISLFLAMIIYSSLRKKWRMDYFFGIIGLFALITVIFAWRSLEQREHLQPLFSTFARLDYWKQTLLIIKQHPFAGLGPGNFSLTISRYTHNSYLQIWAEMGVTVIFAFILIVFKALRASLKNMRLSGSNNLCPYIFISSSVFLIHNLLDFTFFLPEVAFVWWIILGLLAAQSCGICQKK